MYRFMLTSYEGLYSESAMKLCVEYMKMKDFEIDQYITDADKVIKQSERLGADHT